VKAQYFSAQCAMPACERSRFEFSGVDLVHEESERHITYLFFCLRCSMEARA
jgi:hypothetical protein